MEKAIESSAGNRKMEKDCKMKLKQKGIEVLLTGDLVQFQLPSRFFWEGVEFVQKGFSLGDHAGKD